MFRTLLKSKIHRARVTEADLHYVGSVTIDPLLMEAADIIEHEQVDIYDITNGARLTTYAIAGPRAPVRSASTAQRAPGQTRRPDYHRQLCLVHGPGSTRSPTSGHPGGRAEPDDLRACAGARKRRVLERSRYPF